MKRVTLDAFLALGWSPTVLAKLRDMAARPDVKCLVAWDNAGKLSASAYTEEPGKVAAGVAIWRRPSRPVAAEKARTKKAVELVRRDGLNPNTAARQAAVHPSAVYRALRRAETKPICPCCGQVVREGFEIKIPSGGPASA